MHGKSALARPCATWSPGNTGSNGGNRCHCGAPPSGFGSVHVIEPPFVGPVLAGDYLGELGVNPPGDLPGLSVADRLPVILGNRGDLCRGTGEPDLVGAHQHEPGDGDLADLVAEIPGNPDYGPAGDALEDALVHGRGEDLPELVHEDVLACALRDVAETVEHDGLVGPLAYGFPLREAGCDVRTIDLRTGGTAEVVRPLPRGRD